MAEVRLILPPRRLNGNGAHANGNGADGALPADAAHPAPGSGPRAFIGLDVGSLATGTML